MRIRWIVPALAIAGAAGGLAGFAVAQKGDGRETLPESASEMYDDCVANGLSRTECACTVGFYGGRLKADEFRLVAVLNRHLAADGQLIDMAAAIEDMRSEARALGMSDARYQDVMRRFGSMAEDGAYGGQVGVVLRDNSAAPPRAAPYSEIVLVGRRSRRPAAGRVGEAGEPR